MSAVKVASSPFAGASPATIPAVSGALPVRPAGGFRRPALMSALALAEHLVAAPVPMPEEIRVEAPVSLGGEALVVAHLHRSMADLLAWQEAFGGAVRHEVWSGYQVYSALEGRVFDAPFRAWTLRSLPPVRQADERRLSAQWVAEHGDRADWAPGTVAAYQVAILRFRLEVAR